jgi:tRNA (cytidine/uridine-2'-O-)-methyltransferase
MGVPIDIIEPCGFPFGDAALRRAGLDYLPKAQVTRHVSWESFLASTTARLVLASTAGSTPYTGAAYREDDTLLLGQETSGVPPRVAESCGERVYIPMVPGMRSLNVAVAGGMILGEMLRQTRMNVSAKGEMRNEH